MYKLKLVSKGWSYGLLINNLYVEKEAIIVEEGIAINVELAESRKTNVDVEIQPACKVVRVKSKTGECVLSIGDELKIEGIRITVMGSLEMEDL
jgi:hypothetical protein